MDVKQIEQIISLLKQNDVTDFELTQEGTTIKLSRSKPVTYQNAGSTQLEPAVVQVHTVSTNSGGHNSSLPSHDGFTKVDSPLVGTYYSKPSPESESFVKEGSVVKKGDTLCIIEAMKLMNEIESPVSGKVEKVFARDGQVVEFAEVLFVINPNG